MGITLVNRSRKNNGVKSPSLRPDIQGLRALAVLLVIADHLFAYPSGGFIGVDVFFVVSGFLITGLLVREHERSGRISFANFYRRRARRILPIAALVIAVTVAAAWVIFPTNRAKAVSQDGIWALLFGANWDQAVSGTNYMEAGGVTSPLQHYWSLAVEEQFYLAWPIVILVILGVLAKRMSWGQSAGRIVLAVAMAIIITGTFAFALFETATSPTFAYFSTFSRAWELGVGALLAVGAATLARIPSKARPALAYIGLAGIVASALIINPDSPFPGPWAAAPVLSAALVIAAGTGGPQVRIKPLSNPASQYIGDISYSLYLWHFPVIILLGAVLPLDSLKNYVVLLVVMFGLSAASYFFLEDPIRKSSWLEPRGKKPLTDDIRTRLVHGGVVALALVAVATSALALDRTGGLEVAYAPLPPSPLSTSAAEASGAPPVADTTNPDVTASLAAATWPELTPSVDELGNDSLVPEWAQDGCLMRADQDLQEALTMSEACAYGPEDATSTAVVIGDSVAISYVPAIRSAFPDHRVLVYTMEQCPWVDVEVSKSDGSPHPNCAPLREAALQRVETTQPDMVFLSSNPEAYGLSLNEIRDGATATVTRITKADSRAYVLAGPPAMKNIQDCATNLSSPLDCVSQGNDRYRETTAAFQGGTTALPPAAGAAFLDTKGWFCSSENRCPSFIANTPVQVDGEHLTATFSAYLGPFLAKAVKAATSNG